MILEIEQQHIDDADWYRKQVVHPKTFCRICPIAQGLLSQGYHGVLVSDFARATGHTWQLDEATVNFMAEWDQGFPVHPTTLELVEVA